MAFLSMGQDTIGLDIGKSSIIGVQLGGKLPAVVLRACYERPIPEGLVFEGEVLDPSGLAREMKAFAKEARFKGKLVNLGVGNQKVIVRNIEVPDMGEAELRGAIEFQAQDYIPIPVEEVVLDFQVVSRHSEDDGSVKQQVLLVAAQKDMIKRFMDAGRESGLRIVGIDVSAFALIRSLAPPVSFVDQGAEGAQALGIVNISSSVSTVVVAVEGVPKFTRIVSSAHDRFISALVERQSIPLSDALGLAERVGLAGPVAPDSDTYSETTIVEVQALLGDVAEEFANELRRSLDYYQTQDYSAPIERLIVTGRGTGLLNLIPYLSEQLNMSVEVGNPLLKIAHNRSGLADDVLAAIAPRLAIAVGLALEEVR
jgi:type IV pilus assembly protein PilM